MTRLEAAADRVELRALVDQYAVAADTRDRARFADVFTPDAVLSLGARDLVGHAEIVTPLDYLDAHYGRTMHLVGNHDVTLDGDTAHGLVYCLAHHISGTGDDATDTMMAVRYVDDYVRTGSGWRIARRATHVDWLEDRRAELSRRPPPIAR